MPYLLKDALTDWYIERKCPYCREWYQEPTHHWRYPGIWLIDPCCEWCVKRREASENETRFSKRGTQINYDGPGPDARGRSFPNDADSEFMDYVFGDADSGGTSGDVSGSLENFKKLLREL